jgi:ABC-type hemin transport system substrate-binding protein
VTTPQGLVLLGAIADGSAEDEVVPVRTLAAPPGGDVAVCLEELAAEGLIERVGPAAAVVDGEGVRVTAEGLLVLNPQNTR